MLVIFTTSFIKITKNEKYTFQVEVAEKQYLLKSTAWERYLNTSGTANTSGVFLAPTLSRFGNGFCLVNDDVVYLRKKGRISSDDSIAGRQKVPLGKDRYYQFTTTAELNASNNGLKSISSIRIKNIKRKSYGHWKMVLK